MERSFILGLYTILIAFVISSYAAHSGVCYYSQSRVTAYTVYETEYYRYYYYYSCGWYSRCRGSSYASRRVARTKYRVTYQRQSQCCAGYEGYPYNCRDIDECSDGLHCNSNIGNCTNTQGSYYCGCPDGYRVHPYQRTICSTVENYTSFDSASLSVHRSSVILDGGPVKLSCYGQYDNLIVENDTLLISIMWYHNEALEVVKHGSGIDGEFRSNLTIDPFSVTSVGIYTCQTSIDGTDDIIITDVAITAKLPDPIVEMDIEYDWYEVDDTAIISCSAEINSSIASYIGSGVSLIMSINGVPLDVYQPEGNLSIITSGDLLLHLLDIYFAREYTCRIHLTSDSQFIEESNIVSSISSLRIRLPRPKVYITSSLDSNTTIRNNVHLSCNITAQDVHKTSFGLLQWNRQGHNIKSETLLPVIESIRLFSYKFDYVSQLSLTDLKLSNSGLYACSAELIRSDATPLLLSSDTGRTEIMLNIIIPDADITVKSSPNNRYYDVGDNLQMTCTVKFNNHLSKYIDVNTNAFFKWRKNSIAVVTHDVAPSAVDNSLIYEFSYTLLSVALSDASLYACEAVISSDIPGVEDSNVMTSAIDITVVDIAVTVTSTAAIVLDYPGYNSAELICSLSYQPALILEIGSLEWTTTTNGATEAVNTGLSDNNRVLNIDLHTPGTSVFTCSSIFVFGNGDRTNTYSHDCLITVRGGQTPLQPYSPQHSNITSTTAVIAWTVNEVAYTPEIYTIHYGTIHGDSQFSTHVLGPTDLQAITSSRNIPYSVVLHNLRPFTAYYYYIVAENTEGETESTTNHFNTEESIPGEIHDLTVTVISNTTATVEWSRPSVPNGIIIGYEVNVSVLRELQRSHFYGDLNFRELSVEVRLDPYVPYILSVAAFTLKGRGEIVESDIFFTEQGVPKRGPNYCSAFRRDDGCIIVTWNEMTLVEAGGVITNYNIYLERFTSFTCTGVEIVPHREPIVITTDAGTVEEVICDLPSVISGYSVAISVATDAGEGPQSQLIVLPWIDESESAMNISTTWISDSCLRVEWIPPDISDLIFYYTIRFQPFQNYECGAVGSVTDEDSIFIYHEAVSSSNIVCNLSPYSHYYLSITAMTTEGEQEVDKSTITPIRVERETRSVHTELDVDSSIERRTLDDIQGGYVKYSTSGGINISIGTLVIVVTSIICSSAVITLVVGVAVAKKLQLSFKRN